MSTSRCRANSGCWWGREETGDALVVRQDHAASRLATEGNSQEDVDRDFRADDPISSRLEARVLRRKAHVRPSWTRVAFELDIAPRAEIRSRGLRLLRDADREELLSAFLDSFRCAPEYADHPIRMYRKRAAKYVESFYGYVCGSRSPASTVIVRDGQIVAAALIKNREAKPALLDCLLVRPAYFRQGLATAVTTRAVNELVRTGTAVLRSSAMLANEASIAWHLAFGFREHPDALVARARFCEASGERDRLDALGKLAPAERERLTALAEYMWKEFIRLDNLPFTQRHPGLDE